MAYVLLADDDEALRSIIGISLLREGYDVTAVGDGVAALDKAQREAPNLLVLDVVLPGVDGLEVCRQIRQFSDVPILMISVRRTEDDKVVALELGADDYLTKPFSHREFLARVRALLRRRVQSPLAARATVADDPIVLNPQARSVVVAGRSIRLTPTEFRILRSLMGSPGRVFSPEDLMRQAHSYDYTHQEAQEIVKVHVRRLRQKIERDPEHPDLIVNVRGVGYTFRFPNDAEGPASDAFRRAGTA